MPANSADSSPTSPDRLSRSAMGARFPPALGSAVDCPESSRNNCRTGQKEPRAGRYCPCLAWEETEVRPPAGDVRWCHACSAAMATGASAAPHEHQPDKWLRAARAPWALEPDIALGPLTRRQGMPAPVVRVTGGPQPRGRRLRAHVVVPCAWGGCTPVRVFGGAGNLRADVVATNADGLLGVIPGKHCADGNGVGSQDLQRFCGICFAVHEATWRPSSPPAPPPHPPRSTPPPAAWFVRTAASCPPGPNWPHPRPGRRAAASTHRGCPRRDGTLFVGRAIANAPACHRRCLSS